MSMKALQEQKGSAVTAETSVYGRGRTSGASPGKLESFIGRQIPGSRASPESRTSSKSPTHDGRQK
jgi:hypothetical protein